MKNLRERAGGDLVSHCNCLREVVRECLREVREVNIQVIDFIAGGGGVFAAGRTPSPTDVDAPPLGSAGVYQSEGALA